MTMARSAPFPPARSFYGMAPGEEIEAEIDPGVTLEIRHVKLSGETNAEGETFAYFSS